VIEPVSQRWNDLPTDAAARAEQATQRAADKPAQPAPAKRPPTPPANSYGLPLPPALPIDAVSFDGADLVFGQSGPDEDE
jgi:hypothetical protein